MEPPPSPGKESSPAKSSASSRTKKAFGGLRGRFLLSAHHQTGSLDNGRSSGSGNEAGPSNVNPPSSRMRRMLLFRRARSEQIPPLTNPEDLVAPVHFPSRHNEPRSPPPPYDNQSEVHKESCNFQ